MPIMLDRGCPCACSYYGLDGCMGICGVLAVITTLSSTKSSSSSHDRWHVKCMQGAWQLWVAFDVQWADRVVLHIPYCWFVCSPVLSHMGDMRWVVVCSDGLQLYVSSSIYSYCAPILYLHGLYGCIPVCDVVHQCGACVS